VTRGKVARLGGWCKIIESYGSIDVLMYVAGVCKGAPFLKTSEKLWDWTVETNLKGAFLVSRAATHTWSSSGAADADFVNGILLFVDGGQLA
jgi:NAD(P)-dependent dehydrogenase (short-subunit alcohol dehydrogenase family)